MWLDWDSTLDHLIRYGVISPEKSRRFRWDGNYINSLWQRGKLQEGVHWRFMEPVNTAIYDPDTGGMSPTTYRPLKFDAKAIEALFLGGFEDDPELWVEFPKNAAGEYQFNVSRGVDRRVIAAGCRPSGYNRQLNRKYYTAPDLATAHKALDAVRRFARCGLEGTR